jgi:uncharacterized protein
MIYETLIEGGKHWSLTVHARGMLLRWSTAAAARTSACCSTTRKIPAGALQRARYAEVPAHVQAHRGHCLYSDMGRIFCSIVEDSVGWHDTVCGNTNRRWWHRALGREELSNLPQRLDPERPRRVPGRGRQVRPGRRDLAANVNWFSKVTAAEDGRCSSIRAIRAPMPFVELRFEMDTLVLLHTCPHPMNPAAEYPRCPVARAARQDRGPGRDDFCRNSRPENGRGFANTEFYRLCAAARSKHVRSAGAASCSPPKRAIGA